MEGEFDLAKKLKSEGQVDFWLLSGIIVMLVFGIAVLFSASIPYAETNKGIFSAIAKQLLYAGAGLLGMAVISMIDYKLYKKFYKQAFAVMVVLMLSVVLFGFASHGATRQIAIGGINVQPSEISKYLVIVFFAGYLSKPNIDINDIRTGLKGSVIALVVILGLCLLQKHLSAAIVLCAIPVLMMIVAGLNKKLILTVLAGGSAAVLIAALSGFRMDRMTAWLDRTGESSFQVKQSLYAVGSGGLFGLGPGMSRQKYFYLPEVRNDYIFAVACEELGFIGAVFILFIFVFFVWRGILVAMRAPDKFGMLTAFGITCVVGIQAIINMGVVTHLLPSTGMQLPLFSAGGSSMVFTLCGLGILLNISRSGNRKKNRI